MLSLYKVALGPILLAQARFLRRTALRLPEAEGARQGAAGRPSGNLVKLLVLGDSSAAGVGVQRQSQALAQQVAEALARRLSLRVEWQLVAKSGLNTHEARQHVRAQQVGCADIVVSALGVNDVTSQQKPRNFVRQYRALVSEVFARTGARAAVISGLPPLHILPAAPQPLRWYLGQYARRLDDSLYRWCSSTTNLKFVSLQWATPELMAEDKFHPGPIQYARWAGMVAEEAACALVGVLDPSHFSRLCRCWPGQPTEPAETNHKATSVAERPAPH